MIKRGPAVILACFLTVFAAFSIRLSYGVLLPEMLPSLGITKTEAGLIFSSFFITYTIFSPVLGFMADRINTRMLITVFSAILAIGTFLMASSTSLIEASLFFAIAGMGASACWSPVVPLAQRWVSDKRRGLTLSFIDMGASLGIVISSIAIPIVVIAYDWRMGWKMLSLLAFLLTAINFFMVRNRPMEKSNLRHLNHSRDTGESFTVLYTRILKDIKFWLIGLSYLFLGFSLLIPTTFLLTYVVQELTIPYKVASRLITVMYATSTVGRMVLGHLSDTLGRIRLIIICCLLIAAGSLGIVFKQGMSTLYILVIIYGLGHGAVWPLYAACASDYFPKEAAGGIIGLWTVFLGVGMILSPVISGWTADATGTFSWSFILAMCAAMASLFLLLPIGNFSPGKLIQ